MAAPRKYDPPHEQLGRLMVEARRRGLSFEDFWIEAVRPDRSLVMVNHSSPPDHCVLWPTDRTDREAWRNAILDAKEGWQRAYERVAPSQSERALSQLGDALSDLDAQTEAGKGLDKAGGLQH